MHKTHFRLMGAALGSLIVGLALNWPILQGAAVLLFAANVLIVSSDCVDDE